MSHVSFKKDRFYVPPADEADDQSQKRDEDKQSSKKAKSKTGLTEEIAKTLFLLSQIEKSAGKAGREAVINATISSGLDIVCVLDILGLVKRSPRQLLFDEISRFICPKQKRPSLKKGKVQVSGVSLSERGLFSGSKLICCHFPK